MEADQERYSGAVLDELHLRLQEQYFKRRITSLRNRLGEEGDMQEDQRRLFHLEQLLASVKASLTNLDPEEGRSYFVDGVSDRATDILEQARAHQSLSLDEMGALVQDADLSPEELEFVYSLLGEMGVEVGEIEEDLEDFAEEEEFLELLDVTIDHTVDDPVRVYLREIGDPC
jgi:DNA repair ATPase RecN